MKKSARRPLPITAASARVSRSEGQACGESQGTTRASGEDEAFRAGGRVGGSLRRRRFQRGFGAGVPGRAILSP